MAFDLKIGEPAETNFLTGEPTEQKAKAGNPVQSAERGCLSFFMLLSLFDWIGPLFGIIKEVPRGLDGWTFFIPYQQATGKGWNQRDMVKLLKANGVEVTSSLTRFGECGISVPLKQAANAEYILNRNGVPIAPRSAGAPRVDK